MTALDGCQSQLALTASSRENSTPKPIIDESKRLVFFMSEFGLLLYCRLEKIGQICYTEHSTYKINRQTQTKGSFYEP